MIPRKLLVISGPTATGKTHIATQIAREFNGQLISADSRQIYKGLDIGTGKDHPPGAIVHLIDLIKPNQIFSAAEYQKLVYNLLPKLWCQNILPILIGGTGQYIDSVLNPQKNTYHIPPNWQLRQYLQQLPVLHLQEIYKLLDPGSFSRLNPSDRSNPRRLIRKIEIFVSPKKTTDSTSHPKLDFLHFSLTAPNQYLYDRIDFRVEERLKLGLIDEIKKLLKKYSWSDPGLNTLAYKEFQSYFTHPTLSNLAVSVQKWKFDEHAYARRQKTWFKKMEPKFSVDVSLPDYPDLINKLFLKWYNKP